MPTVLDLLGHPSAANLDGESLARVVRGKGTVPPRPLYAMEYYMWWQDGRRVNSEEVRQEPVALATIARGLWYIHAAAGEEVYDLADPMQRRNLIDRPDLPGPLRALVSARQPFRLPPGTRGPDRALDDRLRALGYVR